MEEGESSRQETQELEEKGTSTRISLARSCKIKYLDSQKARKGYLLPPRAVKILHAWLYRHRLNAYPTEAEKRKLSKKTNLSYVQISNWFTNARRRLLPNILKNDSDKLSHKGQAANAAQKQDNNLSEEVKEQANAQDKMEDLPLPICQELQEKLPDPESSPNQMVAWEAQSEEEGKISTSDPSFSPEPVCPEENPDFSSFYMLVDAAVQKAAELEEEKKQNLKH